MKKNLALVCAMALVLTLLSGCGTGATQQAGLTSDQSVETLKALLTKVNVSTLTPRMDISDTALTDAADELPDITNYPLSVHGNGTINVEIVASTEKAGSGMDGWLNLVAENFNKANFMHNGRPVSVSIRPIASGLATEYILTGKHVPDAFSPTNELWAEMIAMFLGRLEFMVVIVSAIKLTRDLGRLAA